MKNSNKCSWQNQQIMSAWEGPAPNLCANNVRAMFISPSISHIYACQTSKIFIFGRPWPRRRRLHGDHFAASHRIKAGLERVMSHYVYANWLITENNASRVWDEKWLGVDGFLDGPSRFLVESGEDLQGEPLTAARCGQITSPSSSIFFGVVFFFKVLKSLVWLLRNNIYSKLETAIAGRALRESQKQRSKPWINRRGGRWFSAAYYYDYYQDCGCWGGDAMSAQIFPPKNGRRRKSRESGHFMVQLNATVKSWSQCGLGHLLQWRGWRRC